jgi:hypothetical protein
MTGFKLKNQILKFSLLLLFFVLLAAYVEWRTGNRVLTKDIMGGLDTKIVSDAEAQCLPAQACTWTDWYCSCTHSNANGRGVKATVCMRCESGRLTGLTVGEGNAYTRYDNAGVSCPTATPTTIDLGNLPGVVTVYTRQ